MAAPIFIHSLFRTGSTYLFHVFRRCVGHYWCYQEPLHEVIRYAATAPEHLLQLNAESGSRLRHPVLERPYFWEFYQIKDAIVPIFTKELSYDWFFIGADHPSFPRVTAYLQCLIDNARGTPVLECCRSFGRAVALHRVFGGTHIHLWRNPWDQWWSYQVDDYFEATLHLILQATDLPPVLQSIKNKYGIADFHDPDIDKEIAHALDRRLNARESYSIFYSLWLYSYIELDRSTGIAINIDSLSSSPIYRERVLEALMREGITGLDFSDCAMVAREFTSRETSFFTELEGAVHESFRANGYSQQDLDSALQARAEHLPVAEQKGANAMDGSSTVRDIAARQMNHTAWAQRQADHFAAGQRHALEELAQSRALLTGALERLDQRDAEIRVIAEQFTDVTARLDRTENELSNVLGHLRVQTAEGERLAGELSVSRQNLDSVWRDLQYASGLVKELERKNSALHGTMEGFRLDYSRLEQSRSWRMTAPLRDANLFAKRCRRRLATFPSAISDFPLAAATKLVKFALHHANQHPDQKLRLKELVGAYPSFDRMLRALASSGIDNGASRLPGVASEAAASIAVDSESRDDVSPFARRLHKELVSARAAADMSGDTGVREHVSH